MKPTPDEITAFLLQFKNIAVKNLIFYNRPEFRDTLAYLGIKTEQAKQAILGLTYLDYSCGPEKNDRGKPGNIWIFGVTISGVEIYVKLSDNFQKGVAVCISFHIAARSLNYPFKSESGEKNE